MAKINREGFTLLSGSKNVGGDQKSLNIIFVHGLRGHPRDTWVGHLESKARPDGDSAGHHKAHRSFFGLRKNKASPDTPETSSSSQQIFWPEQYLVSEIPQARIWTYGYDVGIVECLFQANNQDSVSQHGRNLQVKLERVVDNEDPIIFVVHSLGGIIVKDAVRRSQRCRQNTKLIVFLGTPHRGSEYANWAEIATNLARLALQDSNKKVVETLKVNNEVLNNIHEEFINIANRHTIKIHSFQEARGITGVKGLHGKVVNDFSSKLDLPSDLETVESINANHMQMVRCNSKDDPRYEAISGVLGQFIKKELPRKEPALAGPPQDPLRNPLFLVPFPRDGSFISRESILAEVTMNLSLSSPRKNRRTALVGFGGVGKSQLAIEYTYRSQEHEDRTSVFWIHASNAARFKQAYREIAEKASLPRRDEAQVNILQLVHDWLSDEANGQWLMILDNVDDNETFFRVETGVDESTQKRKDTNQHQPLEMFLPKSSNGSILVTSRNEVAARSLLGHDGKIVTVESMTEPEALKLMKTRISIDEYQEDAMMLAQALEYIPLAITHAAAYIQSRGRISIPLYLELFRESEANQARLLSNHEVKDLRRDHSIRIPVIATWQITFDQIKSSNPAATDLLALMSMFDRQGIPGYLLNYGKDNLQFEDAIAPLISFSLIREQASKGLFEMHRLVQISTRHWLEANEELLIWLSKALENMFAAFPWPDYEMWSQCQALLPHARAILEYKPAKKKDALKWLEISGATGMYLMHRGEFAASEARHRAAFELSEQVSGLNNKRTLTCLNNLAVTMVEAGKYEKAEELHRIVLEERETTLGPEDPDTLVSVNNLASALEKLRNFEEAEMLGRRGLEERERLLGPEHPNTLTSVNNLAVMLDRSENFGKAELLYRRSLEGWEKLLGPEHPDILYILNNLGNLLRKRKQYQEAESLLRRALEGQEKMTGSEHSNTLHTCYNLGKLLHEKQQYQAAAELFCRAYDGMNRLHGPEYSKTMDSAKMLSKALQAQE